MAVVTVCGDFGDPQNEIASLKVYNLKVHIWRLTVWSLQMMGKVTNAMRLVLMELGFKEVLPLDTIQVQHHVTDFPTGSY